MCKRHPAPVLRRIECVTRSGSRRRRVAGIAAAEKSQLRRQANFRFASEPSRTVESEELPLRADCGPTGVASGRPGIRAIAAIPLRARTSLHRPIRTFVASIECRRSTCIGRSRQGTPRWIPVLPQPPPLPRHFFHNRKSLSVPRHGLSSDEREEPHLIRIAGAQARERYRALGAIGSPHSLQ